MKAEARIREKPIPGTTMDAARDARARAWRYVFSCYEKRQAVGVLSTDGDGMKGTEHDHPARRILPR
jgi:hypothetical protein